MPVLLTVIFLFRDFRRICPDKGFTRPLDAALIIPPSSLENNQTMKTAIKPLIIALAATLATPGFAAGNKLVGWAMLPAATFADGPTSGQFASANPYGTDIPPYADLQPVQGFSAVLAGPEKDTFLVMSDNGFGAQTNSADTLRVDVLPRPVQGLLPVLLTVSFFFGISAASVLIRFHSDLLMQR